MSAKIIKKFPKRFELNEETLRRIYSDIKKRVPDENHKDIIFEIFREDSLVYRTSEVDRILTEDNDSTRKIKNIKIEYADPSLLLEIYFDSEQGVEFTVAGEVRDDVYLLASELKEYIQKEVCNIPSLNFSNQKSFLLIFTSFMLAFFIYSMMNMAPQLTDTEILNSILASTSANEKLDYLIKSREVKIKIPSFFYVMMMFPVMIIVLTVVPFKKVFNYLYPGNVFLFGKQVSVIANRRSTAKNFFWGGLIAFLIAISTGYYFFWLAK
jgi:hypothetical protein